MSLQEELKFGLVDLCLFVASLVIALAVGAFYALKDRNNMSLDNYYFGEKRMSPIPVGLSLGVTFISSLAILSIPVLSYTQGSVVLGFVVAATLQIIPAYLYFIPLLHRLRLKTIFEYLELRFNSAVRKMAIVFHGFQMLSWMGIAVYATSLALNLIFPLQVYQSILLTTGICTFYAALGGMKAIVWVDSIQSIMMMGGILAVCIKTTLAKGGPAEVWHALDRGERNNFWSFNPDPTSSSTLWATAFGNTLAFFYYTCCNHAITQRYQACATIKQSRVAALVHALTASTIMLFCVVNGLLAYAYFEHCDPLKSGQISAIDQIIPFLVVKIFRNLPGMAGIFVVAVYSGMLSTVSSGMNAISGLFLTEFVRPRFPSMNVKRSMQVSKLSGLVLGVVVTGTAFMMKSVGAIAIQLVSMTDSTFGGPIFGVFAVGLFCPCTSTVGATVGLLSGVAVCMWIAMGQILLQVSSNPDLPSSVTGCSEPNTTQPSPVVFNSTFVTPQLDESAGIYDVSYMYIAAIGIVTTVIVALVTSFITGRKRDLNPQLLTPLVDSQLLPNAVRRVFRHGVREPSPDKPLALVSNSATFAGDQEKADDSLSHDQQNFLLVDKQRCS